MPVATYLSIQYPGLELELCALYPLYPLVQPPAFGASSCLVFGLVEITVYENLRNYFDIFLAPKWNNMDYIDAGEYHIIKVGNMNKRNCCINPHSKMHGPGKSFCGL